MADANFMKPPYRAEIGDRLSDDSDCWVIDNEDGGSVAEMMCPADVEEATAKFLARAANNHEALVEVARLASTIDIIGSLVNTEIRDAAVKALADLARRG